MLTLNTSFLRDLVLVATICLTSFVGCKSSDKQLADSDYYLADLDFDHADVYVKENEKIRVVIPQQVVDYKIVNGNLIALRMRAISYECVEPSSKRTIFTNYTNEGRYWLIDLAKKEEHGELTRQDLNALLSKLGLPASDLKTPTDYHPTDEQHLEKWRAQCAKINQLNE